MSATSSQDPIEFVRSLWSGVGFTMPGMVAPTFNSDELEKRITDLKAVEGWLRMNLSMLQMTIQGLEVQQTTLSTVEAVSKMVSHSTENASQTAADDGDGSTIGETLQRAVLWPWDAMQQMQEKIQQHLQEETARQQAEAEAEAEAKAETAKKASARKTTASSGKNPPRKPARKAAS